MFRLTRRTQFVGLFILAFLLRGSSGCSYSERRRAKAIARGHQLFEMHCSGCHSQRRLDLQKVPPDLHGVFDSGSLPSGRSATDDIVRFTILTGRSGIMPSFEGSLSDENIQDIILYLHTLKTPPKAATPAAVMPSQRNLEMHHRHMTGLLMEGHSAQNPSMRVMAILQQQSRRAWALEY